MKFEVVKDKNEIIFTPSQNRAIDKILDFVNSPFDDGKINAYALCGYAGTGKTTITNHIIINSKWSTSMFKCCAPTHKACRVLSISLKGKKVDTIQSMFGFRPDVDIENFDPENPRFAPIGRIKLVDKKDNIVPKCLIIDEASMLNYKLVNYIIKTCRNHKIKILFIGDASQLPPVNESKSYAFDIVGNNVSYLTEIVRQDAKSPITELLSILRDDIKNKTFNFFTYITKNREILDDNDKGFIVCDNMQFSYMIDSCFMDDSYLKDIDKYRIIAYTNARVNYWNSYIRNRIIKDADKAPITLNDLLTSYTTIVDEFLADIIVNSDDYIIDDLGEYYPTDEPFKCFLVKLVNTKTGRKTPNLSIIDHTDTKTFYNYYRKLSELVSDAQKEIDSSKRKQKWAKYFSFKRKYLIATNIMDNRNGSILFSRDLDYGFAMTSHRSQGSTYNTSLVDVNDITFDKRGMIYTNKDELLRRLYVACSRASNKLILRYGQ